jgi:hypothetical protein
MPLKNFRPDQIDIQKHTKNVNGKDVPIVYIKNENLNEEERILAHALRSEGGKKGLIELQRQRLVKDMILSMLRIKPKVFQSILSDDTIDVISATKPKTIKELLAVKIVLKGVEGSDVKWTDMLLNLIGESPEVKAKVNVDTNSIENLILNVTKDNSEF